MNFPNEPILPKIEDGINEIQVENSKYFEQQLIDTKGKIWDEPSLSVYSNHKNFSDHIDNVKHEVIDIKIEEQFEDVQGEEVNKFNNQKYNSWDCKDTSMNSDPSGNEKFEINNANQLTLPKADDAINTQAVKNGETNLSVSSITGHVKTEKDEIDIVPEHLQNSSNITVTEGNTLANSKDDSRLSHKKLLKCHMCEYSTVKRNHLKLHINGVHLKCKKYECHQCSFKTAVKSNLKVHVENVHLKLKSLTCHLCDYGTNRKDHLDQHVNGVHGGQRRHNCHMCDYSGTQESNLRRHVETVHVRSNFFKCDLCDYTTTYKCNISRHKESMHLKLKNEKCHLCDFRTNRKTRLNSHIKVIHRVTNVSEDVTVKIE